MSITTLWFPTPTTADEYQARQLRLTLAGLLTPDGTSDLLVRSGALTAGSLRVHQTPTASMTVVVDPGRYVTQGQISGTQGAYVVGVDAPVELTIAPADAGAERADLIVLRIADTDDGVTLPGDPAFAAVIEVITGTPGVGPPTPPTPDDAVILAIILVDVAATEIGDTAIFDQRTSTVANGGVLRLLVTEFLSATSLPDGQLVADPSHRELLMANHGSGQFDQVWVAPVLPAWGTDSGTTDAAAFAVISHGLGVIPSAVICQSMISGGADSTYAHAVDEFTSSTFRVRLLDRAAGAAGAPFAYQVSFVVFP